MTFAQSVVAMPFNLCLGRNRPGTAAQRILPPEVIEELSKVSLNKMCVTREAAWPSGQDAELGVEGLGFEVAVL